MALSVPLLRPARHPDPAPRHRSAGVVSPVRAGPGGWTPGRMRHPGLVAVTGSELLRDEIERIASAAACPVTVVPSTRDPAVLDAPVVLLGSDVALLGGDGKPGDRGRRHGPAWPGATIIVGLAGEGTALWDAAGQWGADRVAVVPEAAPWLVDVLSDENIVGRVDGRRESAAGAGVVVGVIGGRGGVGATSVCVAVAEAARAAGTACLLVDADPLGPGLDGVLDVAEEPGVRWADLSEAEGRIPGDRLREAVPLAHGLPLLTGAVDAAPRAVREAVAAAGREAFALTVVDIGRDRASLQEWLRVIDLAVLVVPAWEGVPGPPVPGLDPERLLVVVAGTPRDGLDAEAIAAAAGAGDYLAWRSLPAVGRRLGAGCRPADLVGRRCPAAEAIVSFARSGAGR